MFQSRFNLPSISAWRARLRRQILFFKVLLHRARTSKKLIIVIRASGMGDIIDTLPACRRLAAENPACELVYITNPHFSPLFAMAGFSVRLIEDIQCELPAIAYRWFRVYRLMCSDDWMEEARVNVMDEFAASCGLPVRSEDSQQLFLSEPLLKKTQKQIDELKAGRDLVIIHTGPTDKVREWPLEKWTELVQMLATRNIAVVQIGRNYHTRWGNSQNCHIEGAIDKLDMLSVEETACWISLSNCYIGIISGPLHIAVAVGTPAIAIVGPALATVRFRQEARVRSVTASDVSCVGCHHRVPRLHWSSGCPYDVVCMSKLQPQDVFNAVLVGLEKEMQRGMPQSFQQS